MVTAKQILIGTAFFSAGVLSANRIKHTLSALVSKEKIPYVSVEYTRSGAFVNKQQVYETRVGDPRCDWAEIGGTQRRMYALEGIKEQPSVLGSYIKERGADAWKQLLYRTIEAQNDSIKKQ